MPPQTKNIKETLTKDINNKTPLAIIALLLSIIGFFLINIHMKVEKTYEFVIVQPNINRMYEENIRDIRSEIIEIKHNLKKEIR